MESTRTVSRAGHFKVPGTDMSLSSMIPASMVSRAGTIAGIKTEMVSSARSATATRLQPAVFARYSA
jgi:hypothetical protein